MEYSDGTSSNVYSPSIAGKAGKGVKQVVTEYYLSTSKTELNGGEWKENATTLRQLILGYGRD